jgi:hypothetical protein
VNDLYAFDDAPLGLSASGHSELRLATHRRTGQPVVVKALALEPAPAVAPREAIELWRRVENRHLACLFDSFHTDTHAIVCMEAVHGLALAQVMQAVGLSHTEAQAVFKQVRYVGGMGRDGRTARGHWGPGAPGRGSAV